MRRPRGRALGALWVAACGGAGGDPDATRGADASRGGDGRAFDAAPGDGALIDAAALAYRAAVLADQPLVYWRLGDADLVARDATANHRDAAYSGGVLVPGGVPGDPDGAHELAGAGNERVFYAPPDALADGFTIELWVRIAAVADGLPLVSSHATSHATGFDLRIGTDAGGATHLRGDVGSATAVYYDYDARVELAPGAWHYVACVSGPGQAMVFVVDGPALAYSAGISGVGPALLFDPEHPLALGNDPATAAWLAGALDDVAIYPRALTAAELIAHYSAATGYVPPPPE